MSYFIEGFLEAMRAVREAAALSVSIVMLIACFEIFMRGHYVSALFFGTGSCVLAWRSLNRAVAVWRKEKVTP